ncbi:hypothetical protein P22_1672 [Propionispora sp. 2/2-37]|uniref:ATPase n=1 Tax=Propionispora sp. 2/2-37 TaxID=1677858 RepID=UPI0006BB951F|nr:ATPase [Propionispora sp. 2/2-37]CUH95598.1 hypothetical protein P22_1672 [Propionispora sp. 2/2-37]
MSIEQILDELETLLLDASRVPFTNKRVLEEDELARLLDELREMLPGEIAEAGRIVKERQRILDEAQREAQHIVDQAKNYIAKLTDDNAITKQAQEQANEIILQARKGARELQGDAITYADQVFGHLESNLTKALEVIRQGHSELQQSKNDQSKAG